MEEERKKLLFLFVFSTYLPVFLLKFRVGGLVRCGIKFRFQCVPTLHTFDGPHCPKNKKYLKKCDDDAIITFFPGISCFWGSRVRQKYAVWVFVGCRIKFRIQRALPIEIWVKTQGDMSKIQTNNSFFLFFLQN